MKFWCLIGFIAGIALGGFGGYSYGQLVIYRSLWSGSIMNTSMANNREPVVMGAPVTVKHIKAPK